MAESEKNAAEKPADEEASSDAPAAKKKVTKKAAKKKAAARKKTTKKKAAAREAPVAASSTPEPEPAPAPEPAPRAARPAPAAAPPPARTEAGGLSGFLALWGPLIILGFLILVFRGEDSSEPMVGSADDGESVLIAIDEEKSEPSVDNGAATDEPPPVSIASEETLGLRTESAADALAAAFRDAGIARRDESREAPATRPRAPGAPPPGWPPPPQARAMPGYPAPPGPYQSYPSPWSQVMPPEDAAAGGYAAGPPPPWSGAPPGSGHGGHMQHGQGQHGYGWAPPAQQYVPCPPPYYWCLPAPRPQGW